MLAQSATLLPAIFAKQVIAMHWAFLQQTGNEVSRRQTFRALTGALTSPGAAHFIYAIWISHDVAAHQHRLADAPVQP